jgi:hypothetical protein
MARQRTFYVAKNGSWHTLEFLEKRQYDPKYRSAYYEALDILEQERKELVVGLLIIAALIFVAYAYFFHYRGSANEERLLEYLFHLFNE